MQPDRARQARAFLARTGWGRACRAPLAGDASARQYERLTGGPGGARAVLMDAPAKSCPTTAAFVTIARHLDGLGFSAPKVLHADIAHGFLLLEDLGDDLFARVAQADPGRESALYAAAMDFLAALQRTELPDSVRPLDHATLAGMIGVTYDWYAPAATPVAKHAAIAALGEALSRLAPVRSVLALRDFHAENLIWLPARQGVARVGLLDFQDAFAGHPAYDVISLTRDARRDVPLAVVRAATRRYLEASGGAEADFSTAAATLAVQRNLRILGVFARLALRDARPGYIAFIPRVWAHIERDLAHPALAELHALVSHNLPPPTPHLLNELREKCPIAPAQP